MFKTEAARYKHLIPTLSLILYTVVNTDNIKPYNIKSITIVCKVIEKEFIRRLAYVCISPYDVSGNFVQFSRALMVSIGLKNKTLSR